MRCTWAGCREELFERRCPVHGWFCTTCDNPASGKDSLCSQCEDRKNGVICAGCGSPWVFMTNHEGNPLCRPCWVSHGHSQGYFDDRDTITATLQERETQRQKVKQERTASAQDLADRTKRERPRKKQEEEMFE